MVVLDATSVNIALPSAQRVPGFSTVDRQWVVTAYALAFGSLLLSGGRPGDLIGRRITFLAGAATSFGALVAARAAQGASGALLAPAALSILTTTFSDPKERGKAFGAHGAIVGAGEPKQRRHTRPIGAPATAMRSSAPRTPIRSGLRATALPSRTVVSVHTP